MADNVQVYTEGGMPSNRQVCGVRNTRLYSTPSVPLTAADKYLLFDLSADEVVIGYGIDVLSAATDAGAVTAVVSDESIALISAVDLKTVGKTAGVVGTLTGDGLTDDTISVVITGVTTGVDINVYAIVANVASPETFTIVDTPAP